MSDQKTFDPFVVWKEYYKNMENYWGKTLDETMRKEEFSEWMGKVIDLNLFYKQMVDKSAKQYLDQVNLPSRDDLSSLSSLVVNLDTKVDDLEERVEESLDNQMSPAVVKREMTLLKKEVKDIGTKLDDVLVYLKDNKAQQEKMNKTQQEMVSIAQKSNTNSSNNAQQDKVAKAPQQQQNQKPAENKNQKK